MKTMRRTLTFMILFSSLGIRPAMGSRLMQTQLGGLRGVDVSVSVTRLLDSEADAASKTIKSQVEAILCDGGLSVGDKHSEWLSIKIQAHIPQGCDEMAAIFVSVQLREHVSLVRDSSLDVPGGGAITWWREQALAVPRAEMRMRVESIVKRFVGLFVEQVQLANRP